MTPTERHAVWLAIARTAFGLPALAAPETSLRLLRARPGRRPDPARFFVAFFGVREVVLAAAIAAVRRKRAQLTPVLAIGALADIGDTAFLLRDLTRRDRVDPLAALFAATGIAGSAASAAVLWEATRPSP